MCAATRMVLSPQIEIQTKDLVRVLLIDDEPHVRDTLELRLKELGWSVDTAENPTSAGDLLQRNKYQVIIADVVYEEPKDIEGDRFIVENQELMRGAKKVVITGKDMERIHRRDELEELGVLILRKGEPTFDTALRKVISEKLEEQKNYVIARIQEAVPSILKGQGESPQGGEILVGKVQEMLVNWLRSRKDPDRGGIFYGGKEFSPNMLIEEIEKRSDAGVAYFNMFLNLVKHNLRL